MDRARGILFASSVTAPMIRRQVVAPSSSPESASSSARAALFLDRILAVALKHQLRRPPNVDLGYHAGKAARFVVDKGLRSDPAASTVGLLLVLLL